MYINKEMGKFQSNTLSNEILHEGNVILDQNIIANLFNKSSLLNSVLKMQGLENNTKMNTNNCIEFLNCHYDRPFPAIKWHYTSTHEIIKVIKL